MGGTSLALMRETRELLRNNLSFFPRLAILRGPIKFPFKF